MKLVFAQAARLSVCARHWALERLIESSHGQVVFEPPHPRADGATHLLLDPLELIEKMSVLIPPPSISCASLSWGSRSVCGVAVGGHSTAPNPGGGAMRGDGAAGGAVARVLGFGGFPAGRERSSTFTSASAVVVIGVSRSL